MADSPESSGGADRYATARANIRDTTKWLVAAFAAVAAVVVGGSPFSNLGALQLFSERFWFAVGGLVFGFLFAAAGLYKALRLLQPLDPLYVSDLNAKSPEGRTPAAWQELQELQAEIEKRKDDLLPQNYRGVDKLLVAMRDNEKALEAALQGSDKNLKIELTQNHEKFISQASKVLDFAAYLLLYRRLINQTSPLFLLAIGALIGLAVFGFAANPPKNSDAKPTYIVVPGVPSSGCSQKAVLSSKLDPVRFATGLADVTPEGLAAIGKAREILKSSDALLLLVAHTDTVASPGINRALARKRGQAVRQLLLEPGGIAASRVFVAELPELALPELTVQERDSQRNRSVEFLIVQPQPC